MTARDASRRCDSNDRTSTRPGQAAFRACSLALALLAVFTGTPAVADLVLSISPNSQTTSPGGTGSFDVILTNTSTTTTFSIASFQVELQVASGGPITFTNAVIPSANYIFQGNSAAGNGVFPFVTGTNNGGAFPATEVSVGDIPANGNAITLAVAQSVDLATYSYSVAANAAGGTYDISNIDASVDPSGMGTLFGDINANLFGYTYDMGSINVPGSSPVPEPASIALLSLGGLGALFASRRKRGKSQAA